MSSQEERIASDVEAYFRNQARQAGWVNDPVGWAKDVLGVHLWSKQDEICQSLISNKRTVVASCHGTGKALGLDELVHTPSGPVRMGDIREGMEVLGSDGKPVGVIAVTGEHKAESYRVRLERGGATEEIIASADHLWPVLPLRTLADIQIRSDRARVPIETGLWHHRTELLTTRELAGMRGTAVIPGQVPEIRQRGSDWEADEAILDLFAERGGLDPAGRTALLWRTRQEVPDEIEAIRARMRALRVHTVYRSERSYGSATRYLSLMGTRAPDLLADPNLRALARSHLLSEQGSWGDDGWRIVSVKPVGERDVQCIQVDAPDHLYLCGERGIPTHNSMIASVLACWWVSTKPPGQAIVVSCYTDDTEVLTKDGWKLFKYVRTGPDGDEFATRSPETKRFEWQHAFRYYEAPWDGEVVDVTGRSIDLRVTPNHRMAVQWSTYKDGAKTVGETFKRADEIGPRGAELPALSQWEGKTPETVTFGKHTWAAEDFAAFLGAWMAEGSLGPARTYTKKGGYGGSIAGEQSTYGGLILLTQLPSTKGYEPYRELLTRMLGREPAQSQGRNWSFACSELYTYLKKLGKAHEKYIPGEVKEWGPAALKKFLKFYLLGDGWFQKSSGKRSAEGYGSWRSCTVSKRLADDLQEIAQKTGGSATITERAARDGGTLDGSRKILKENCRTGFYLVFGDSQTRRVKTSRSHYKGNVYCVSVPNETLYVRRGGSPIWCGNTAPTYAQVNKILWEEIRKHHSNAALGEYPMPGRVTQADEWKLNDGQIVGFGRKPAKGDRHSFHGIHRRYVLALLDEACHDDQTEVMTEDGWKLFADLTGDEALLTMDQQTHEATYRKPQKIVKKPYAGPMYLYEAKGANFCVTPDHDMYFHGRTHNRDTFWRKAPMGELVGKTDKYMKKTISWTAPDRGKFELPEVRSERKFFPARFVEMDDWMTFLGWYLSEGHLIKSRGQRIDGIGISQDAPEAQQRIFDLLVRLGFNPKRTPRQVHVYNTQLARHVAEFGLNCLEKSVPRYARMVSARQIGLLLDSYLEGDGYEKQGQGIIYTSSPKMADDLQEMILKTGKPSVVHVRNLAGRESDFGTHVATSSVDGFTVTRPHEDSKIKFYPRNLKKVDYDGMVYCASVPPEAMLLTRRNGYSLWSGNCGVPEEIWTGVEAITTNVGCRILAIGNPDDRNTDFGKNFIDGRTSHLWNRISIPASSTPNFTGEVVPRLLNEVLVSRDWVQERLDDWGEKDPRYISKVLAQFPEQSMSSLFPPSVIADAVDEPPAPSLYSILRIGVDVARFGSDKTVVASYSGLTAQIEESWSSTDTVSSAYKVLEIAERLKEERKAPWVEIRVDAVGLGAGVVDTLNARSVLLPEPWFSVYEMHGSASPPANVGGSVYGFYNARAYWFDQLRQKMRNGSVKLIDDDAKIADDLRMVFYQIKNGRLLIASKEEMRAQFGRSPDLADAIAYATAPVADGLQQGDILSETADSVASSFDEESSFFAEESISPF